MRALVSFALLVVSFLAAPIASADVSEATFTPQGRAKYAAVAESQVDIFIIRPDFKFKVIGVIEAQQTEKEKNGFIK